MNRKIAPSGTVYLAARATPCSTDVAGSEALLRLPQLQRGLSQCGGWQTPILAGPGDAAIFGDLAAYGFADDAADAEIKVNALATWLDLHVTEVDAVECTISAQRVSGAMVQQSPLLIVRWSREVAIRISNDRMTRVVRFPSGGRR